MLHNSNDPSKNIQDFRLAIVNAGITPPEQIIDDGKLHRFPTNEKAAIKTVGMSYTAMEYPMGTLAAGDLALNSHGKLTLEDRIRLKN